MFHASFLGLFHGLLSICSIFTAFYQNKLFIFEFRYKKY